MEIMKLSDLQIVFEDAVIANALFDKLKKEQNNG
jgi:hypothetical protein